MLDMEGDSKNATVAPSQEALDSVSTLATKYLNLKDAVADAQDTLDRLSAQLKQVEENELPEAMDMLGFQEFRMTDGRRIKVAESVHASIPKAGNADAMQWLRDHDHGSLIKNEVSASFGKGEEESARQAVALLREQGWSATAAESVHNATLKSFVKEMLANGETLPEGLFHIHTSRKASVDYK